MLCAYPILLLAIGVNALALIISACHPVTMKLNTKQVAEMLGVSPSTVQVWRHRGQGPKFTYYRARVVYSERTVRAFLKRMKKQMITQEDRDGNYA